MKTPAIFRRRLQQRGRALQAKNSRLSSKLHGAVRQLHLDLVDLKEDIFQAHMQCHAGQENVLRDLLRQALEILDTLDPDSDELPGLETLMDQIEAAL